MAVKIHSSVQFFDPEKARSVQSIRYKNQRKITQLHLNVLKNAMSQGTFSPVNSIMFAQVGDDNVCINGQNTMQAIIETGKSYTLPVVQYHCDTEEERAQLYSRIDHQRRRSLGDSVRALDVCDNVGLTPTQIAKTVSAFRHIKGNWGVNTNTYVEISDDKGLSMLPFWVNDVLAVYDAITPCSNEERGMVLKKSVFSVAIITMHYQKDRAFDFWRQIAQDNGLERYDPRKTIRTWLIERSSASRRRIDPGVRGNEASRAVALAWNAYYQGRTLRYTIVRDMVKPIEIAGTPYNGAQSVDFLPEWTKFDFGTPMIDVRSVA